VLRSMYSKTCVAIEWEQAGKQVVHSPCRTGGGGTALVVALCAAL
jgi:hypothetical protein